MMHSLTSIAETAKNPSHSTQRGIALFIVMVIVLLTTLLVLWSSRSALFNEIVTGNDVDYQRAFEAAQAMMRDAELDIMGEPASGRPAALPANIDITNGKVYFPRSDSLGDPDGGDLVLLESLLPTSTPRCVAAICVGQQTIYDQANSKGFWQTADLTEMKKVAASYGQFTGAKAEAEGNRRLNEGTAWYWVEPMHYVSGPFSQPSQIFSPNGFAASNAPGFVFLITAIAEGKKQGTRVVLQRVFVRQTNTL